MGRSRRRGGRAGWRRPAASAAAALILGGCSLFGGGRPAETPAQAAVRAADEERIRREVEARIAAEPSLGPGRVRVEVMRGTEVALHGPVRGLGALQCAVANAELVRGVTLVIDQMVLEAGPRAVQCLAPRASPAGG